MHSQQFCYCISCLSYIGFSKKAKKKALESFWGKECRSCSYSVPSQWQLFSINTVQTESVAALKGKAEFSPGEIKKLE